MAAHTVLRNGLWRFASNGFAKIVRLVLLLGAARVLGPTDFGAYAYALSLASLAFLFAEWGMNAIVIREVNQNAEGGLAALGALGVKALTTGVSFAVGIGIFILADGGQYAGAGIALLVALAASNMHETFIGLLIGKQRGELEFVTSLVEIVVLLGLLIPLFLSHQLTVISLGWSFAGAAIAALCTSALVSFRAVGLPFRFPERAEVKRLFWAGLPMAWFGIIGYGFFSVDQLFLKHYLGLSAVGEYAFATRIIYSSMVVPSIIASVMLPVFARSVVSREHTRKVFRNGLFAMLIPSVLLIAGVAFLAAPVIARVAPEYSGVLPVLTSLSFLTLPLYVLIWVDNVLTMMHRQWINLFVTLIAVAMNVGLNAVLVPSYGMMGSLSATAISQSFNVLVTIVIARRALSALEK